MSLTAEQLKARDGRLTASRVACLMTGDAEKVLNLWREMVGDPSYVPEDLSGVWPVQLGTVTEALNLDWYERLTGATLTRRGEVVVHPEFEWAACTLDGFDAAIPAPIECKHVGGYETRGKVIERYQPQLHWQMIVTGTRRAVLSIIEGAKEPVLEEIDFNGEYAAELWTRAQLFMDCVLSLTPPSAYEPVAAPVVPAKTYDMASSNAWGEHAATWLKHRAGAKAFDGAAKELKALVPADGVKAFGHGVTISRSKAGSLTIKEA